MSSFASVDCDLKAMELSCMEAFVGADQLAVLLQIFRYREEPDNQAFERDFTENIEE